MVNLLKTRQDDIQRYFVENNYDFSLLKNFSVSYRSTDLFLCAPIHSNNGLLDETPLPIVLAIHLSKNGKLIFEETEYTKTYLGKGAA